MMRGSQHLWGGQSVQKIGQSSVGELKTEIDDLPDDAIVVAGRRGGR
jgi:hypothetical protein